VVQQPPQTTLKLKMSAQPKQSIKIKFGNAKESPRSTPGTATPAPEGSTSGVLVHNGALERQRELVAAGMNPGRPAVNGAGHNSFNGSKASSVPSLNPPSSRSVSAISPPRQTNGVKNETAGQSPALRTVHPVHASHPVQTSQLSQAHNRGQHPPNNQQQLQPPLYSVAQYHTPSFYGPPPGMIPGDSNLRAADQDPSTYILPTMKIATHPGLHLDVPYSYVIPASDTTLHSSMTFTLPTTHHVLHLVPHIPVAATTRLFRLFVTVNGIRQPEYVRPGIERDKERPLYEARLDIGAVNRIEVELLAGGLMKNGKEEIQWEKMLVFVHVRKN
jgi:hypothetical protein